MVGGHIIHLKKSPQSHWCVFISYRIWYHEYMNGVLGSQVNSLFFDTGLSPEGWYGDVGLLIFRVVLGLIIFSHGFKKIHFWRTEYAGTLSKSSLLVLRTTSVFEVFGATGLMLGLFTHILSSFLIALSLGLIYAKIRIWGKRFSGEDGWEFDLMVIGGLILLFMLGAGGLSLDQQIIQTE